MSFLARLTLRLAILALCFFLTVHLIAAVSLPILQALGEGLQRVRGTQMVSVSPATKNEAIAEEVARNQ